MQSSQPRARRWYSLGTIAKGDQYSSKAETAAQVLVQLCYCMFSVCSHLYPTPTNNKRLAGSDEVDRPTDLNGTLAKLL
jgi:hypothetical protein